MSGTPDTKEDKVEMPGLGVSFIGVIVASLPRVLPIAWIKYWLNHGKELRDKFAALFKDDPRFEEIGSFPVIVPEGYEHETVLTKFKEEHCGEFCYYDPSLTDANFAKTSKLTPGRKFRVKMIAIKSRQVVSSDDCLRIIAANKGVLTGAQGVILAYEQGKSNMSRKGTWFVSFDNSENLPYLNDSYEVPCIVTADTNDGFVFSLDYFEDDWCDNHVLLCFCDEES